jgi:magnesium transporter
MNSIESRKSMLRSLVAQPQEPAPEAEEASPASSAPSFSIRRNVSQADIETAFANKVDFWLDVVDPTDEEIEWLVRLLKLNPQVEADIRREDRRPTLMAYVDYMFISLFQPHIHMQQVEGREIHCLVGEHFFATVRRSDATAVDNAYNRLVQNPEAWKFGVSYLLYMTSQYVIDQYYPMLDRISNELNKQEEKLMENGGKMEKASRKGVYRMKQQLIKLRQMIAPQREVFSNVLGENRLAANENTRDLFRHLYERLLRVYDEIDSQRDVSNNVVELLENQESRKMGEAVNRLTVFSMIFLPLTIFTSLFQLNFTKIIDPMEISISGTILFLGIVLAMAISVTGMLIIFRRRGWI